MTTIQKLSVITIVLFILLSTIFILTSTEDKQEDIRLSNDMESSDSLASSDQGFEIANDEVDTSVVIKTEPKQIVNILDYVGKPMTELQSLLNIELNSAGNLVYEGSEYDILIESRDSVTSSYVQVELDTLSNCKANETVIDKVDEAMVLVGLDPSIKGETDNPGISIGAAQFCEYGNKEYDISVACFYDGANISVGLSNDRIYCDL